MRLTTVILLATMMQVSASSFGQNVNLKRENASLKSIFNEIKKQTGYIFLYRTEQLSNAKPVTVDLNNANLDAALIKIFANQDLGYSVEDKMIIIKGIERQLTEIEARADTILTGKVIDASTKKPIAGATISIKEKKSISITNADGNFRVMASKGQTLSVSYIGFKPQSITINSFEPLTVSMEEAVNDMKDLVITGIVERKAATFTGAAKTITGEELRRLSPTNLFAAIQMVEPAFRITPDNVNGGNINTLPTITVRGEGSFPTFGDQLAGVQNLPLFVLDGFEVNLSQVGDLDMNRIASITILKDASSTSMYGARGANGVMVITTIVPPPGKLEVTLTNTFTFSAPDLSVYNLLNSEEKLIMEERAGLRTTYDQQYFFARRYEEMLRGVNTDWKQIPTQNGLNNRTTLGVSGGDQTIRYNVGFNGQLLQGVMKGQDRNNYSGNFSLSYNVPNKFNIRNTVTATQIVSNESPYGDFSSYLSYNPYTRPYNEDGSIATYIENIILPNPAPTSGQVQYTSSTIPNPLADTKYNTIDNRNKNFTVINQTSAQVFLTNNFNIAGNFGITKVNERVDNFKSAFDSDFASTTIPATSKGRYAVRSGSSLALDGQARATYNNRFGPHTLTANANFDMRSATAEDYSIVALGFPFDKLDNLTFASQYEAGGKPTSTERTTNTLSYGALANYTFENRYFADFSYTRQGSSAYGVNNKYGSFWSAGLGWNLHNEVFLKSVSQINSLRIRGSYGSTGSSATDPYAAQFRYNFDNSTAYYGKLGAQLAGLANLTLGPQNRLKANLGFDASAFKNRLNLTFDVYQETTLNSINSVSLAPSTGFATFSENLGKIRNRGINFDAAYQVINNVSKALRWTLSINGAANKSTLQELSAKMKAFNELYTSATNADFVAVPQFIEGNSLTGIYVVPSLGVEPTTGQEIFVKRDGTLTYLWNTNDRILMGDFNPSIAGTVMSIFNLKGFSLAFGFRYEFGGQQYNSTLANRVEGVNIRTSNVDRRAYDLGWTKPGDLTQFKRISATAITPRSTSRFLQDNNSIELQSLSANYTFENAFVQRLGLKNLRLGLTTNSTYRWSTIRVERGTANPFSREFSLSLNTRF